MTDGGGIGVREVEEDAGRMWTGRLDKSSSSGGGGTGECDI